MRYGVALVNGWMAGLVSCPIAWRVKKDGMGRRLLCGLARWWMRRGHLRCSIPPSLTMLCFHILDHDDSMAEDTALFYGWLHCELHLPSNIRPGLAWIWRCMLH